MSDQDLGSRFVRWALADARVVALVRIGSWTRGFGQPTGADRHSDFDFQLVTSDIAAFAHPAIFSSGDVGLPLVHVMRAGRLGSAPKLTCVFGDGDLDVVLIPLGEVAMFNALPRGGSGSLDPRAMAALTDLRAVIMGGYEILKGAEMVRPIYEFVEKSIPLPRLNDPAVVQAANGFVCDYVSMRQKIARGEWIAAQRWLHLQLGEALLRLAHEAVLREGGVSFPDGRRIELTHGHRWAKDLVIAAAPERDALIGAADRAAESLRKLMQFLVGEAWRWPDLPMSRLGAE